MSAKECDEENLFSKVLNGMKTVFNSSTQPNKINNILQQQPLPNFALLSIQSGEDLAYCSENEIADEKDSNKPRIVLKFRSQKSIVSNSESEHSNSEDKDPKRLRRRSKDLCENILANAIARKEKSYQEPNTQQTRLSRRIKPTAKVLANRELRIGLETQNNARLGLSDKPKVEHCKITRSKLKNKNKSSSQLDNESDKESNKEFKRINKLKKKHLKKLGLKAVSGQLEKKETKDRDNFTDESTMDSTNTEAIIEHLNSRAKSLIKSDQKQQQQQSRKIKNTNKHKRKNDMSDSEESDKQISVRVTRKRSKMNDNEPIKETSSKDEETHIKISSCFCESKSDLYADPNSMSDVEFCRAVELVGGRLVGCGRLISTHKLVRAGPRAPFFLACNLHHYRLNLHHCCAGCGVFCSQGEYYQCDRGHLFHWECGLPFVSMFVPLGQPDSSQTVQDLYNPEPGCPHCGVNSETMEPVNMNCSKVTLDMKCSQPMILLPNPRLQWLPARMSFSGYKPKHKATQKNRELSVIPKDVLENIKLSLEKIASKKESVIDYDDLLIRVNRDNQKDMNLIKAVCEKENTIECIVDAINSGGDPKKRIPHVDNGTFVHLAARELNLCALHIFRSLGCELNALDIEQRTPLMLAVMNYDTEFVDKVSIAENGEEDEPRDLVGHQKEYRMVVDYLLKAGADVSIRGPNGATILHLSSKYGDIGTCESILDKYAQHLKSFINQKDEGGWSPLVWAVENKRRDVVRFLLEKGADPCSRDSENNTALHWAAMVGCNFILEDLLNFGAQVNVFNSNGDTPLHLCARHDHYRCVVILLARGADVDCNNFQGEQVIDCVSDQSSDCYSALIVNRQLRKLVNQHVKSERIVSHDISNGKENQPVRCVNAIDDEDLDGKFTYVTKSCFTIDVNIDRKINSMQTCQCKEKCGVGESECACSNLSMKCWYESDGRLVSDFDYNDPPMIFECNDACNCNKLRCSNRCLEKGFKASLKVFRQSESSVRGGGWGVCTLQPISKGTLVSEYVGEILPGSLAFHRDDDSYLFELELKDDILEDSSEMYCIDAKNYGNVSRFINHKCEPNLVPVRVFVDHRDLHFPRIAFFACKDINSGEELGFDYGSKFWKIKIKSFTCNCNSKLCRYDKKDRAESEEEATETEDLDQESE